MTTKQKIIFIEGNDAYQKAKKFMKELMPKNLKNIKKIYFDRGIYKYHGRVKIFAETLRKNGMEF